MNTTITKEQMIMHDGEVLILDFNNYQLSNREDGDLFIKRFDMTYYKHEGVYYRVLYSTAKLEGVIHLQREWFVKPFDMEGLQDAFIHEHDLYHLSDRMQDKIKSIAEDAYNTKKGEFTRDEMEIAVKYGAAFMVCNSENTKDKLEKSATEFINSLRPLSLPKKIVLSPDGELIEIQW